MQHKQQGAVLAMGLILLLVVTIIGVAGSSQSLLGERLAGNEKQVAEAFMAAETGLVNAVSWLDNKANATYWGNVSYSQSAINTGASRYATASLSSSDSNTTTARNTVAWRISNLTFAGNNANITSCGAIDGAGVSRCLTITYVKGSGGGNLSAMNIIGKIKTFDTANSNQFKLIGAKDADGNSVGPALATDSMANVELIVDDINSKGRMANYVGGIKEVKFDDPFGDPEKMAQFIAGIKKEWDYLRSIGSSKAGTAPSNMGSSASPKITYYKGNLSTKGSGAVGAGILVIEGNLSISGNNFDFEGLVVVTGQSFSMSGGGHRDSRGSVVFANPIKSGDSWSFGQAEATFEFDINGGGNATFTYDAEALKKARDLLADDNIAKELWQFNGSGSGGSGDKGKVVNWASTSNSNSY